MSNDPNKIRYSVGAEIKHRRLEKKWSAEYLAHRSGLHPTSLGRVERGEREPRMKTIAQIAGGLGVPLHELLKGNDD